MNIEFSAVSGKWWEIERVLLKYGYNMVWVSLGKVTNFGCSNTESSVPTDLIKHLHVSYGVKEFILML